MKTYGFVILTAIGLVWAIGANAAPERVSLKNPEHRAKELTAETQIKTIELDNIEDPTAKRAIEQIINYLGLKTQGELSDERTPE